VLQESFVGYSEWVAFDIRLHRDPLDFTERVETAWTPPKCPPEPEPLIPPKGLVGSSAMVWSLMWIMPDSIRSASSKAPKALSEGVVFTVGDQPGYLRHGRPHFIEEGRPAMGLGRHS
jgi:hypothetical protein